VVLVLVLRAWPKMAVRCTTGCNRDLQSLALKLLLPIISKEAQLLYIVHYFTKKQEQNRDMDREGKWTCRQKCRDRQQEKERETVVQRGHSYYRFRMHFICMWGKTQPAGPGFHT